ncbi:MAG: hypothetical protein ACP6IP_07865 [Candidatus Njordarchaeia archaeon]
MAKYVSNIYHPLKTIMVFTLLLASTFLGGIGILNGNSSEYDEHIGWMMGPWFAGMPLIMWILIIAGLIIIVLFIILLIRLIEKV